MIPAATFLSAAKTRGLTFFSGVPCSFLTPLMNGVTAEPGLTYVGAASEGEAVAIAAGAWLGGRATAVICQNSGLGNAVNPLTSLNAPFRVPTLLVVTWRGQPGLKDEPQHEVMGRITQRLLDTIEVPHAPFPTDPDAIGAALDQATATMARGTPFAFVMAQGSVRDEPLTLAPPPKRPRGQHADLTEHGECPTRIALLEALLAALPADAPVIATTGKSGRELFTLQDREQHLYQVGSMGGASGMALGVALATGRRTVVIDGDGAALMKLGSLATIGAFQPPALLHVLLDNGAHDSTGGQPTVSENVDFAAIALACGYRAAWTTDTEAGFRAALAAAVRADGPVMLHARIQPGSLAKLGRPTIAPHEVAQRFRRFLAAQAARRVERAA